MILKIFKYKDSNSGKTRSKIEIINIKILKYIKYLKKKRVKILISLKMSDWNIEKYDLSYFNSLIKYSESNKEIRIE